MRNSYLLLTLAFIFLTALTPINSENLEASNLISYNIESYLESIDVEQIEANEVIVFSNFLVKENGDFIIVDFMVEENGNVTVLNQEFDEEYYLFDRYSSKQVVSLTSPIATIRPQINKT